MAIACCSAYDVPTSRDVDDVMSDDPLSIGPTTTPVATVAIAANMMFVFIFFIWGCAGKRYRDMSISNPQKLISIEDSLFQSGLSKSLKQSLVFAHHNLGNQALEESQFDKAKYHFDKALFLSPQDSVLDSLSLDSLSLFSYGL